MRRCCLCKKGFLARVELIGLKDNKNISSGPNYSAFSVPNKNRFWSVWHIHRETVTLIHLLPSLQGFKLNLRTEQRNTPSTYSTALHSLSLSKEIPEVSDAPSKKSFRITDSRRKVCIYFIFFAIFAESDYLCGSIRLIYARFPAQYQLSIRLQNL